MEEMEKSFRENDDLSSLSLADISAKSRVFRQASTSPSSSIMPQGRWYTTNDHQHRAGAELVRGFSGVVLDNVSL